jgi:esterase/lipase
MKKQIEKINFENSRGLNLVGDFYKLNSKKIIIMCHGFTADRHENGRFDRIAKALNSEGYNILNFDFSGSGESDNDSINVEKELSDFKSVVHYVKDMGMKKIGAFGHSLGGLVCLKTNLPEIQTMVLTAPVTNKKENYGQRKFTKEQLVEFDEKGYATKIRPKDKYFRETIIIDKKIISERENLNQQELLSKIKSPVLIIHGDKDTVIDLQNSKDAMGYLSKDSKLEILSNDGHDFSINENKLISLTKNWFNKYLK